MAEITNLRRERKRRARADAANHAAANRAHYGTPPALRRQADAARQRDREILDGKKRACRTSDTDPDAQEE